MQESLQTSAAALQAWQLPPYPSALLAPFPAPTDHKNPARTCAHLSADGSARPSGLQRGGWRGHSANRRRHAGGADGGGGGLQGKGSAKQSTLSLSVYLYVL